MKRLIIEQLKEGFIFTDENDEKYAVSDAILSQKVKAYFGLTDHKKHITKKTTKPIAPPAKVSEATKPETQGSKTADSHSAGATDNYKVERKRSAGQEWSKAANQLNSHAILQNCVTPFDDILLQSSSTEQTIKAQEAAQAEVRQLQGKDATLLSKLSTPDNCTNKLALEHNECNQKQVNGCDDCNYHILSTPNNHIMHPSDLKIAKFEYDKDKMRKYKTLEFLELPDGRVVLEYMTSKYYTTTFAVRFRIPYPFPKGYFSKENGWSSSVEQAFKMYRRHLAEQEEQKTKIVKAKIIEDPDDWKYKPLLKKDTRGNHGEDYEKIEGSLE